MPSLEDIVVGRVSVNDLREVTIDDILGRAKIRLDESAIRELIHGRRVMITGAGGSIGSELCRQISRFGPERIVLYEQSEFNLYEIDRDLARIFPDVTRHAVLGDTRDNLRVSWAISEFSPQIVLHAAAYKHVPLLEINATEGILNNILGTRTVAKECVAQGVDTFVMVSTDKAVNPTNIMGATKRLAEIYCQNLQTLGATKFITVRFGNVLGSVGSVVPLFKEQIRAGGPLTVTHPDMKRYFMTIPEASQLVLQAATMGAGGELFVLDMGKPVKIVDLARDMIRLCGRDESEIEIQFTGLRPGEKLYEELLYDSEELSDSGHEKIFLNRAHPVELDWLDRRVEMLLTACRSQDEEAAIKLLKEMVPSYCPEEGNVAQIPQNEARSAGIRSPQETPAVTQITKKVG
jgi:FlaA1/EpsC-like NDP-sugar epimerase